MSKDILEPKEKAQNLIDKCRPFIQTWDGSNDCDVPEELVKQDLKKCALITVDEIIDTLNNIRDIDVRGNILLDLIKYWLQVKDELTTL